MNLLTIIVTNSHRTEFSSENISPSFWNFSILVVSSHEQDWKDSGQTRMGHWINLDGQWANLHAQCTHGGKTGWTLVVKYGWTVGNKNIPTL